MTIQVVKVFICQSFLTYLKPTLSIYTIKIVPYGIATAAHINKFRLMKIINITYKHLLEGYTLIE